jgi:hypothetical protein
LRENNDRIADANVARFSATESGRSDIREKNHLFVTQFIRNFREIRLCVWNEEVFSLCAIDRIAETPTADRFYAFAVPALCPLRGQARATLSTRRDCADEYAISDLVSIDAHPALR